MIKVLLFQKQIKYGITTFVNDNFCKSSEYSKEELIGKTHSIVKHPENPVEFYKDLWNTILKIKN
ncbi:MAG: PAS domain S-box protein [Aliarcobacter sp.]|nr:PAS domain S-box protein [Aliarcobacter sp.]